MTREKNNSFIVDKQSTCWLACKSRWNSDKKKMKAKDGGHSLRSFLEDERLWLLFSGEWSDGWEVKARAPLHLLLIGACASKWRPADASRRSSSLSLSLALSLSRSLFAAGVAASASLPKSASIDSDAIADRFDNFKNKTKQTNLLQPDQAQWTTTELKRP